MKSYDIYHMEIKKENEEDEWLMNYLKEIFSFPFILCEHNVDNNGPSCKKSER